MIVHTETGKTTYTHFSVASTAFSPCQKNKFLVGEEAAFLAFLAAGDWCQDWNELVTQNKMRLLAKCRH